MQTQNHPTTEQQPHHEGAALALPELPKSKGETDRQPPGALNITLDAWQNQPHDCQATFNDQHAVRRLTGLRNCQSPMNVVRAL